MARRNFNTAKKGQVYASEWPEWHIDCAHADCEEQETVAGLGEAYTIKEAEKSAEKHARKTNWKKFGKLWFCPKHQPKREA